MQQIVNNALHFLQYGESIKFDEYEIKKTYWEIEIFKEWVRIWIIYRWELFFKDWGWFRATNFELAIEKNSSLFHDLIDKWINAMEEENYQLKQWKKELEEKIANKVANESIDNLF